VELSELQVQLLADELLAAAMVKLSALLLAEELLVMAMMKVSMAARSLLSVTQQFYIKMSYLLVYE